jgi:hypothetical protein
MQPPSFIAFTGVDRLDLLPGMRRLSASYPIEWGVLVDPPRRTAPCSRHAEIRGPCWPSGPALGGSYLRRDGEGDRRRSPRAPPAPAGVQRVQVNHSFKGSTPAQVAAARDYGRRLGVRTVLQCSGAFPHGPDRRRLAVRRLVRHGRAPRPLARSAARRGTFLRLFRRHRPRYRRRDPGPHRRARARSTGSTWSRAYAPTAPSTWPSAKPFAARSTDERLAEAGHPRHRSGRRRRPGPALSASHPELKLLAITTVFGNADIETTTRNALWLRARLAPCAPVYRGAAGAADRDAWRLARARAWPERPGRYRS